ncbi:MAG: hypothetical protein LBQ91_04980 [Oscillospiraceae bacterium]|jgi:hypothetical protein|nr:hypothetical protein [Oscillospiraceae bacterium]
MEYNFAKQQARRIFKNKLLAALIACAAWSVFFLVLGGFAGARSMFDGGERVNSVAQLEECYDKGILQIRIQVDEMYDFGWIYTSTGKKDYEFAERYYYFNADKVILIRMPARYTEDFYSGVELCGRVRLQNNEEDEVFADLAAQIKTHYGISEAEARNMVSDIVIVYDDGRFVAEKIFFFTLLALPLISLLALLLAFFSLADETRLKCYKALARAGNMDPAYVNNSVSRELQEPGTVRKGNGYKTRSYRVIVSLFSYAVVLNK